MFAAIDRPVQRDAAPGVVGGECREHAALADRARTLAAMSRHGRPRPAAVRAPIRRVNSSEPSVKRPSASICHMKRSGCCALSTAASSSQAGSCGRRRFGWLGRRRGVHRRPLRCRAKVVRTVLALGRDGFGNGFRDRFARTRPRPRRFRRSVRRRLRRADRPRTRRSARTRRALRLTFRAPRNRAPPRSALRVLPRTR